jgi:hypothetical protein
VNPQRYGSMVDVHQGVYLVGSERYTSTKSTRDLEQIRKDLRSSRFGKVKALGPGFDSL